MKKLISLLAVSLLSVAMATAASAEPNVAVADVEAKAGETVTVDVVLKDNVLFDDLSVEFGYDASVLTLKSATKKDISGVEASVPQKMTTNPYNMMWVATSDFNGKITTLTFEVNADAKPGKYAITVDYYKGAFGDYVDGKSCNFVMDWEYTFEAQPIGLTYTDGSITVVSDAPAGPDMEATLANDVVSITAVPAGEAFAGKFIVAAYNGEELAEVIVTDAAATASATITADYDDVKVMWWDSLTSLTSIVDAIDL